MEKDTSTPSQSPQPETTEGSLGKRVRNLLVALVAIALSTTVFLATQTQTATASLASLAESATPLDIAVTNSKPSLVEFYANWCTSCQAMAGDMAELKDEYGDRVNFVMLNVDNSKWLPEVLQYRVDGIPHFVFMDAEGGAIASTIGEQPKAVLAANLDALATEAPLPYLQSRGRMSEMNAPLQSQSSPDDPRSHGSQVVQPKP